jgi:hypothetical protein
MDAYFDELVRACEIQEGLSNNEDAPLQPKGLLGNK